MNPYRTGNITSSEIVALMSKDKSGNGFGKPALTYIDECNMERRLGRTLGNVTQSHPTSWGLLLEKRVLYDLLETVYQPVSTDSIIHPDIPYWCGSPDAIKHDQGLTIVDVKCPFTLSSFCKLVDGAYKYDIAENIIAEIRAEHKDGEKYYWQLVSNSILAGAKYAELIVYVPYLKELDEIRELAHNYDGHDQKKFTFIGFGEDAELPYLRNDGYYKNLNIIRFEVPQDDKDKLTERVLMAGEMLDLCVYGNSK